MNLLNSGVPIIFKLNTMLMKASSLCSTSLSFLSSYDADFL